MAYALLGYGTVGKGVVRLLCDKEYGVSPDNMDTKGIKSTPGNTGVVQQPIRVYVRSPQKVMNDWYVLNGYCSLADDWRQLIQETDIIFDAACGPHGLSWDACRAALESGKTFITANKAMVSEHYVDIFNLVEHGTGRIYIEACVCGGMPLIKVIQNHVLKPGNDLQAFYGIINGSTNWLLCEAEKRHRSDNKDLVPTIAAEMQGLGYLEADPTFDLEGVDAAYKLCILKNLVHGPTQPGTDAQHPTSWRRCGLQPCQVDYTKRVVPFVRGVSQVDGTDFDYAKSEGYAAIKLVAVYSKQVTYVLPAFVQHTSNALASTAGADNTVALMTAHLGTMTITGPGAGMYPTASAMISDLAIALSYPDDKGAVYHRTMSPSTFNNTCAEESAIQRFVIRYPDRTASDSLKKEGTWLQPWVYYPCSLSTLQNETRSSFGEDRSIDDLLIFAVI